MGSMGGHHFLNRASDLFGEGADFGDHSGEAVAPLGGNELVKADLVEESVDVESEYFGGVLPGVEALEEGNEAADDFGVGVGDEFENVGCPRLFSTDKVDLAHSSLHARGDLFE